MIKLISELNITPEKVYEYFRVNILNGYYFSSAENWDKYVDLRNKYSSNISDTRTLI